MVCLTVLSTASASSRDAHTKLTAPIRSPYRPSDFAYDWHATGRTPAASKARTEAASASRSPLA